MQAQLTSEDTTVRARAVLLLAEVRSLGRLSATQPPLTPPCLTPQLLIALPVAPSAPVLAQFFGAKMADWCVLCVRGSVYLRWTTAAPRS